MSRRSRLLAHATSIVLVAACSSSRPEAPADAGVDGEVDSGAAADASVDGEVDSGAAADASVDGEVDSGAAADAGACDDPWADCNGDKRADGCEVDTDTDVAHCGGCGDACSTDHIVADCAGGSCEGGDCDGTWADCNGDKRADGCEVDTDTDVAHCGGCGDACSTDHAVADCAGGSCEGGICEGMWADCNGDKRADGCEVDTDTDVAQCGGCGEACSIDHVAADCAGGSCEGGICAGTWVDCNGDKRADGCEVDTDTDVA
ncbi:MAG: hypothetical protein HYY06_21550, partial [Deltaproteobacteria bacterium]|nr:hypothetical protein [Deltaproteobacteria bacterium]